MQIEAYAIADLIIGDFQWGNGKRIGLTFPWYANDRLKIPSKNQV